MEAPWAAAAEGEEVQGTVALAVGAADGAAPSLMHAETSCELSKRDYHHQDPAGIQVREMLDPFHWAPASLHATDTA